jgi:MarR family 2-MHQ and catechol resistance regulon transcriptional repressor
MPTHYHGPKHEVRALDAYIPLFRAVDTLAGRSATRLEAAGLTQGQFAVLEALLHLGSLCQSELSHKLLRAGGNITMVVDNLEKRGWVRRVRGRDDRRFVAVHLTAGGKRLIQRIFPEHAAAISKEMSCLTVAEQETLRRLCRKLGRSNREEHEIGRRS